MAGFRMFTLALASGVALAASARADALWFDPPLTTPIVQGQWYVGVGTIAGLYRPPSWNSNVERFSGTSLIRPQEFSSRTFMIGPGGTVGYTFADGTLPAWVGTRARVALSGMYWSGDRSQSQSHPFAGTDFASINTVDGRVGFNGAVAGAGFRLNETLRTDFNAFELALRISADRPLTPALALIQSVGVFGGRSVERYQSSFDFTDNLSGLNVAPGNVNERVASHRVGADVGLGLAWQVMPALRWGFGGRAGFHWVRSRLDASDCWQNDSTSACSLVPTTFLGIDGFATTATDSRSTVGFRGSLGTSLTLDGGWIQAQLGGFATFDSASPGVVNPTSGAAGVAPGTNIGPARIRFGNGYTAGGFFLVRVQLP